jgi:tRNA A37 threonylcarbamoyladenosine biosynthesis protein TsaE
LSKEIGSKKKNALADAKKKKMNGILRIEWKQKRRQDRNKDTDILKRETKKKRKREIEKKRKRAKKGSRGRGGSASY